MIKIENISKAYGEKQVLDNFNATFTKDKVNFIMGNSGCGKTTLLNIIMGLEKADNGKISGTENKTISTVFQEERLCNHIDAVTNVHICCKKGTSKAEIAKNLCSVGLDGESITKPVSKLSGGMARRVAIVRAVMAKSVIVIMDEPFKGLDENTKLKVVKYIRNNMGERLFIVVTHSVEEMALFNGVVSEM